MDIRLDQQRDIRLEMQGSYCGSLSAHTADTLAGLLAPDGISERKQVLGHKNKLKLTKVKRPPTNTSDPRVYMFLLIH